MPAWPGPWKSSSVSVIGGWTKPPTWRRQAAGSRTGLSAWADVKNWSLALAAPLFATESRSWMETLRQELFTEIDRGRWRPVTPEAASSDQAAPVGIEASA